MDKIFKFFYLIVLYTIISQHCVVLYLIALFFAQRKKTILYNILFIYT